MSVIAFPTAFPERANELHRAESLLLSAIRWWVAERRSCVDPLPRLCEYMDAAGAHDAAFSVDRLMEVIARTVRRQFELHCPRCSGLSDDEKWLLHAAWLVQARDKGHAEIILSGYLKLPTAVDLAVASLEGLCLIFIESGLRFRRRRSPGHVAAFQPWSPELGAPH